MMSSTTAMFWQKISSRVKEGIWFVRLFAMHPSNRVRIRGRDNQFSCHARRCKGVFVDIVGHENTVAIGPNCRLEGVLLRIRADGASIHLGGNVQIGPDSLLQCQHSGSRIKIGNRSTIESAHVASTEGEFIEIGENCMLSSGVILRNGDSHPIFEQLSEQRINRAAGVSLGNGVWVGSGVRILKGSKIGTGSIIGEASVVTGTIEPNAVAVGVPARVVRRGVRWQREF